jgi:NAD(P)-dependent dehydrogenase (short-subunit alcohol dehydrogenase family)
LPAGRLAIEAAGRALRQLSQRLAVVIADHQRALLEGPFAAGEEISRAAAFRRDRAFALALLKREGGAIVNLSSISGIVGGHNLAAYNASKGGVRLLTKSVALHGARLRPQVRCNSVHPAFLEGPMVDDILAQTGRPELARGQIARDIPLGRLGEPSEVAELCVYLLSDESRFVTGAEFVIDGGLTAR